MQPQTQSFALLTAYSHQRALEGKPVVDIVKQRGNLINKLTFSPRQHEKYNLTCTQVNDNFVKTANECSAPNHFD